MKSKLAIIWEKIQAVWPGLRQQHIAFSYIKVERVEQ